MKSSSGRLNVASDAISRLSAQVFTGTSGKMTGTVPDIFDRNARRLRRGRVSGGGFFTDMLARDLVDRLDSVKRDFRDVLIVGAVPMLVDAIRSKNMTVTICDPSLRRADWAVDEDRIDGTPESFDLILACGTLDSVADLPGALIQMRRLLRPDALLLANFAGAPTLSTLRQCVARADEEAGQAVARFHPQIDVRSAGDLLTRAGYALPVADLDSVEIAYATLGQLLTDLREAAATNVLTTRHPVTKKWLADVDTAFSASASADGKTHETISYITLTGWAPAPDQPKPARRGSGTTSLASILNKSLD